MAVPDNDKQPPNGASENGHNATNQTKPEESTQYRLSWRNWLEERFNWSWFTCTQSTGGIAIVLFDCPKQFSGLKTIGVIIFICNILLFLTFTLFMILRWASNPSKIYKCFTVAPECYFFGSYWLSMATMIMNMRYGIPHTGPWLVVAIRVCFWIYAAISLLSTTLHFVIICKYTPLTAIQFAPPTFLMIFNAMLTGTVAAAISDGQPPAQRLSIMVAGVAFQGLGWIVCLLFLPWFIGNLLENGWPPSNLRPGLFITVGSSGFTIVALIGIARAAPRDYGYFAAHPIAAEVVLIVATWSGVFMWLFAMWLFGLAFFITVLELLTKKDGKWKVNMTFNNTWWGESECFPKLISNFITDPGTAFIFPNVGWTLSTVFIGQELQSEGIIWFSVAMIILLVMFWLLDLFLMTKAVITSLLVDARVKLS